MPKGKRLTAQQIMDNYKPGDLVNNEVGVVTSFGRTTMRLV